MSIWFQAIIISMLKSQLNSTDIYSNESQNDNEIVLKIEGADPKWAVFFLNAQGSDFKIRHGDYYYPAHRNVIFKNINLHVLDMESEEGILSIPESFNPQMVQGVLSCLYSLQLKICRSQALQVLEIIHCLHIRKLKQIIQEDIKNNLDQYQLFVLLEKSRALGLNEIEDICLNQLQVESYEQMKYEKYQLLSLNEDTFKFLIIRHNERRWQDPSFGHCEKYIQQLIQEYTKHNNYSQKDKNRLIKDINEASIESDFPNFQKVKLTPLKINNYSDQPVEIRLYTPRSLFKDKLEPNSNSPFDLDINSTKSMIVDLTYMGDRKRKGSKGSDNPGSQNKMASDYIVLKQQNRQMSQQIQQMLQSVQKMAKTIKQKEVQNQQNKFKLGQIEGMLEECQKELMEDNRSLMLLDGRIDRATLRRIKQSELYHEQIEEDGSSSDEDEDTTDDISKSENQKDQILRVSLIQSKWVAY